MLTAAFRRCLGMCGDENEEFRWYVDKDGEFVYVVSGAGVATDVGEPIF